MVRERLPDVTPLLDMATGGGEFLSSLVPLPPRTVATEGYPPNLEVARRRSLTLCLLSSPRQCSPTICGAPEAPQRLSARWRAICPLD